MTVNPARPIVIIEDNPMDVDLTLRAFNQHHLANPIHILRDGEEALTYFQNNSEDAEKPAVIFLDLHLPKVDGLEVLSNIRKNPVYCNVPVVILTTSMEDRDVQQAYKLGANSYIVKPVDFDGFIDVAKNIQLYWLVINTAPL
jgi:CheY-like chemotaxis protein